MKLKKQYSTKVLVIDAVLALIVVVVIVYLFEIKPVVPIATQNVTENSQNQETVSVQPLSLLYEVTPAEQSLGLSNRASLPSNEGMLFIFPAPGDYGFWMKDMNFSIDMIWMDNNFVITHIEQNVSPDTYPHAFYPNQASSYVLEANAGYSQNNNLSVGETLDFVKNSVQNMQ